MKLKAYNSIPYSTSRENKFNENLSPESVAIDNKDSAEHLAFISEYAKHINYYDLNNKKAGNWYPFFSHNDIVFLSIRLQIDIQALQEKKNLLYNQCTQPLFEHLKKENSTKLQLFFIELVELMQTWLSQSLKIQEESISYELKNAIKNRLLKEVQHVITQDEKVINAFQVQNKLYEIYENWQDSIGNTPKHELIAKENFKITDDPHQLGEACNSFLNTIRYILKQVPKWLQHSLAKKENHNPPMGVALAFLNLLEHIKNHFNNLSVRHLDYYYRQLLQETELSKKPDRCVVFFELAKEAQYGMLKKGTRLSAGQTKEGKEIIYNSCEDEELSKSKLIEIHTLFISTNPLIAPLNKANLVTGMYYFQKHITAEDTLYKKPYNFYLFGADPFGNSDIVKNNIVQPDIGWAIAAPVLSMKEGERSITLSIRLEEESMAKLWEYIEIMTLNSEYSAKEMMYHFFSSSFDLKITGAQGWVTVEHYAIDFKTNGASKYPQEIVFLFSFGKEASEIVPFNPIIHQTQYDTSFPVLQMILKSNHTYYPYSLLKDVRIDEIVIHTNCEGIRNLDLYDAFGKLENNKPFEPFGPNPLKGESFYVGYAELSDKKLTSMAFDTEWYKLPQQGFESYYQGYPEAITNDSFTFTISALSQGEWVPKREHRQQIPLFQHEDGVLLRKINYDINTDKLYYIPDFIKKETPFAFENAVNGFFKLELETPLIGFGHEAYLRIMTNTVYSTINAKNTRRKTPFIIPENPFVPKMRSIRMRYSALQQLNFNTSKQDRKADGFPFDFFHLHPFGVIKAAQLNRIKQRSLVPEFDSRGYLYLGLNDINPRQLLSLYFKMTTNTNDTKAIDPEDIVWEYLSETSWKLLRKENIIKDDTVSFTNSGIVKILIPSAIKHYHPLFLNAAFWLRISSSNALDILRNCEYINTQAVLIERDLNSMDTTSKDSIPENTITTIYDKNTAVKSIFQPFASFGGRSAETTKEFYHRVSERLFHKNRAIVTGDYERLILEEFPELFQVSCLTSTLFPDEIKPNELVIMVLRNIKTENDASHWSFNSATLEKVKRYILSLCPPFVKITVRNPLYEGIRVSCAVKLKDNRFSGERLKKLQQAINAYIAPWLYHDNKEIVNKTHVIHAKGLKNVVSKQEYVDFVTNFSLVQFNMQDGKYAYRDTAVDTIISPAKPWSVFIPVEPHNIKLIDERIIEPPTPLQISVMKIEDDFIIQPDQQPTEPTNEQLKESDKNRPRIILKVQL